jgi:FkbM family methyltransferase
LRGRLLRVAGASLPVRWWLSKRCRADGVKVRAARGGVDFQRGTEVIRVAPKHAFFATQICGGFDALKRGAAVQSDHGLRVTDFTAAMDRFNTCRACLAFGAVLEEVDGELRLRRGNEVMLLAEEHAGYSPYLAEYFGMYFSPLLPERRDGLEVLDYSRPGILQTYRKSGLQFEMASFPEEEDAMEEYFRYYRPKAGDLVFDVGAHCGVSSYWFSKMVGDEGTVVCFEPDPVNYELLVRNVERHGLKNVRVERAAIAGERGELAFSAEGTIGSRLASLREGESAGKNVTVEARTLADAFEKNGVPAFCKIDI